MNFPVTQSFDFFRNPQSIVDYANTLQYFEQERGNPSKNYPGTRSPEIWDVNHKLFEYITRKQLSLFYSLDHIYYDIDYNASMTFQKITSEDTIEGEGLIHQDIRADMTSIIYLSPDLNDNGTNIWLPNDEWQGELASEMNDSYWHKEIPEEAKLDTIDETKKHYQKAATLNSIYNSCIMFDGSYNHSANLKLNKGEERLTLITFYFKIKSNRKPISNMRKL